MISATTLNLKNQALEKATAEAEKNRAEADLKRELAVKAARAANEQNRSAVDSQVELMILLERRLRYVAEIQNDRPQLLDKAMKRLEAAAQAMANLRRDVDWNPEDEEHNWRSLARAHQALGQYKLSRNEVNEAMAQYREAEDIITRVLAAQPGDLDLQVNLLRTQRQMGYVLMFRLADAEKAQHDFKKAIEISRACLAKKPDSDTYKSELANSLGMLARSEMTLGHLDQAGKLYAEEFVLRQSFSPAQASQWESRRELASHYADRATLNLKLGNLAEGQRLYDQCTVLRVQLADLRPGSWAELNDVALSYNNQGSVRFPQGSDPVAARKFHQKALDLLKKRAKDSPLDFDSKHLLELTLYYEATCALHSGDKEGAAAGYQECLKICKELATQPKYKHLQSDLMLALARCGDHAGAAKIARELVATHPKDEGLYVQSACGYALAAGALAQPVVTPTWSRATKPQPSIACARPRNEAGPTSRDSKPTPISNRSGATRHFKPSSATSGHRAKKSRDFTDPGGGAIPRPARIRKRTRRRRPSRQTAGDVPPRVRGCPLRGRRPVRTGSPRWRRTTWPRAEVA